MTRHTLHRALFLLLLSSSMASTVAAQSPEGKISTAFDATRNRTTVRLATTQFAGPKDKYDRLSFSVFYHFAGRAKRVPQALSFELLTVVKARQLDSDLYVVFLVDGEEIFLSSDRSAVLNPVPGKRWVGERLVFRLPYETFRKFTRAKSLAIKLDGLVFDFSQIHIYSLRELARYIQN